MMAAANVDESASDGPAQRKSGWETMDDCTFAGVRSPGQLFRSGQSLCFARRPASLVWRFRGDVRLSLERLQLDLRVAPTAFGPSAGSLWCPARGHRKHGDLECGFLRYGRLHRHRRFVWGAIPLGGWRSADISRKCKSDWLLVSRRRTEPGHGN